MKCDFFFHAFYPRVCIASFFHGIYSLCQTVPTQSSSSQAEVSAGGSGSLLGFWHLDPNPSPLDFIFSEPVVRS